MNIYIDIYTILHIYIYKTQIHTHTHTDESVWDSASHKSVTVTMLLREVTWLQSCNKNKGNMGKAWKTPF